MTCNSQCFFKGLSYTVSSYSCLATARIFYYSGPCQTDVWSSWLRPV